MAMTSKKNLLGSKTVYNAYYGDFRGVDFSSDHTRVSRQRLAYLANMYKDYRAGQGQCLETIPGFRRRFTAPNGKPVYGIHFFGSKALIHAGEKLYEWDITSHDVGITAEETVTLTEENTEIISEEDGIRSVYITLADYIADVKRVASSAGDILSKSLYEGDRTEATYFYNASDHRLRVSYGLPDEPYNRLYIEYVTVSDAKELTAEAESEVPPAIPTYTKSVDVDPEKTSWTIPMPPEVGSITDVIDDRETAREVLTWEYSAVGRCLNVYMRENPVHTVSKIKYTYIKSQKSELTLTAGYITETVLPSGAVKSMIEVRFPESVTGTPLFFGSDGKAFAQGSYTYDGETRKFSCAAKNIGKVLVMYYVHNPTVQVYGFSGMNERASVSFVFNNRLYIIDGKNYLVYDGEKLKNVLSCAYIPTTYINAIPGGENADAGTEYELRNLLQPLFRQTFAGDGETKIYNLNFNLLDAITEVKINGEKAVTGYTADPIGGTVTFDGAPAVSAAVEITMRKKAGRISGIEDENAQSPADTIISGCTVATVFDGRIFMAGNPKYPNHIFWSGINDTGYSDPTYFGELNYMQDGVGLSPITGMIPLANALAVLKNDVRQDGSVYYHTPTQTGENLMPKTYPSVKGLNGAGCLGACINFRDDPVFVSEMGLEAIGQLSVRYERALEHRSGMVDARLINLDLSGAVLEVWNGYLMLLCDGKIFMADSRQRYTDETGVTQYEWYYLEDIAVYEGQYTEYLFASSPVDLEGKAVYIAGCPLCTDGDDADIPIDLHIADNVYDGLLHEYSDRRGTSVNSPDAESGMTVYENIKMYYIGESGEKIFFRAAIAIDKNLKCDGEHPDGYTAYLCETRGNKTGGTQKKATVLKAMDGNLYFGTENGVICSFNFDKRDAQGEIPAKYYSFDGRTIYCGCATKMDSCDIPHLTKTTVKKSTVIKTKAMARSAAKIKVRTNKKPYNQIARINSAKFSFVDMDFSDFSFETMDQSLYSIKEKEKKWVEKQYYIYSDEYLKPFSLYYISYRYTVAGRYKG